VKNLPVFVKGLMTGLVLQLAIGPVFIFIVNTAIQGGLESGMAAVAAVTIVDYLYIALAVSGIGKLLERQKKKHILTLLSSAVLIFFGALMIKRGFSSFYTYSGTAGMNYGAVKSFISAFILTISSPLTILFWSGVFTSKAIEYSLEKRGLLIFGLSAGLATFIFLGISVVLVSCVKVIVPVIIIQALNILVGVILIGYGVMRTRKAGFAKGALLFLFKDNL